MENFKKTINPIMKKTYGGRSYRVFISIKYKDGKLSISGVEGPLSNGNCLGGCGQIDMHLKHESPDLDWEFVGEWDNVKMQTLLRAWEVWHLNDLHAECPHQEIEGKTWKTHPSDECAVCGWKLGHGWQSREVPEDVLSFLINLPDSEVRPAWI